MSKPICEVCGSYEGTPHRDTCPFATLPECRECLADDVELIDGLCAVCHAEVNAEPCEACDGTGYGDEWTDEEGASDCEECGGDGFI